VHEKSERLNFGLVTRPAAFGYRFHAKNGQLIFVNICDSTTSHKSVTSTAASNLALSHAAALDA
jgi:hypothetical protein